MLVGPKFRHDRGKTLLIADRAGACLPITVHDRDTMDKVLAKIGAGAIVLDLDLALANARGIKT